MYDTTERGPMSIHSHTHPLAASDGSAESLPRAHIDPIDHEATALALIGAVMSTPPRDETIIFLLDQARRGLSVVVVDGTVDPDDVLGSVEALLGAISVVNDTCTVDDSPIGGLVVTSVRPRDPADLDGLAGFDDLADADRWLQLDDLADQHAIDLVEWFVLDGCDTVRVTRPRDLLNEPPRWSPIPQPGAARSA